MKRGHSAFSSDTRRDSNIGSKKREPSAFSKKADGSHFRCQGISLAELLVVATILGIIATVALPTFQSSDPHKLDLAATQVAEAIRFAQSEAMRTGEVHRVRVLHATEDIEVDKTDLTTLPASAEYLLRHPVTKQLYDFNLNTAAASAGVEITNTQAAFDYSGLGRRKGLMFDAQGTPMFFFLSSGETHHLAVGQVQLGYGPHQRIVQVDPYTGRVTIQ